MIELFIQDIDTVMLVLPIPTPLAKPDATIISTELLELFQVTLEVMSAADLTEYTPMTLNCLVAPNTKSTGMVGVIAIKDNVIRYFSFLGQRLRLSSLVQHQYLSSLFHYHPSGPLYHSPQKLPHCQYSFRSLFPCYSILC